tara:strand:- start:147400 stop:147972 length:573 start_codon:yes stop_codon:yes gene_type:complete
MSLSLYNLLIVLVFRIANTFDLKAGKVSSDMKICNIAELSINIYSNQRILCLDLGSKIIGLALSDVGLRIASPYKELKREKFSTLIETLKRIAEEENIVAIIVGLPLNMDGSTGPAAQSAKDFASNLAKENFVQVALWDERLSTIAVERSMIEADLSRKKRSKIIDKVAATFILQGALDFICENKNNQTN